MELNLKEIQIIDNMIEKYGSKQMIVAVEELSELQKEICKKLRNPESDNTSLTEELADCYIMLLQISMYYEIDVENILKIMKEKLQRTKERYL